MGTVIYKGWWKDDDPRYKEGWTMSISITQPLESKKPTVDRNTGLRASISGSKKISRKKPPKRD